MRGSRKGGTKGENKNACFGKTQKMLFQMRQKISPQKSTNEMDAS